jgi:hypothetical protein
VGEAKKVKSTHALLATMPVDLRAVNSGVASTLIRAAEAMAAARAGDKSGGSAAAGAAATAARAAAASDAAREATFLFLDDASTATYAPHAAAYAAASLLYAEALLLQHAAPSPVDVLDAEQQPERSTKGTQDSKSAKGTKGKGKGKASPDPPSRAASVGAAALRALDLAMLRGGVSVWAPHAAPLVHAAEALLHPASSRSRSRPAAAAGSEGSAPTTADATAAAAAANAAAEANCPQWLRGAAAARCTRVERVDARTLTPEAFAAQYMGASSGPAPVVLTHALEAWPALQRWADLGYLRRAAGAERLVPVETCRAADASQTYLSDSWQQVHTHLLTATS